MSFKFNLTNPESDHGVLYSVGQESNGQELEATIEHAGAGHITFNQLQGDPSRENYHFAICFEAGFLLSPEENIEIRDVDNSWTFQYAYDDRDGTDRYYGRSSAGVPLQASEQLKFTIQGIRMADSLGPKYIKVMLKSANYREGTRPIDLTGETTSSVVVLNVPSAGLVDVPSLIDPVKDNIDSIQKEYEQRFQDIEIKTDGIPDEHDFLGISTKVNAIPGDFNFTEVKNRTDVVPQVVSRVNALDDYTDAQIDAVVDGLEKTDQLLEITDSRAVPALQARLVNNWNFLAGNSVDGGESTKKSCTIQLTPNPDFFHGHEAGTLNEQQEVTFSKDSSQISLKADGNKIIIDLEGKDGWGWKVSANTATADSDGSITADSPLLLEVKLHANDVTSMDYLIVECNNFSVEKVKKSDGESDGVIDQENFSNTRVWTPGSQDLDRWQSFTAGQSGYLYQVDAFLAGSAFEGEIIIYAGASDGETALDALKEIYRDDYEVSSGPTGGEWEQFKVDDLLLEAGKRYTIRLTNFAWAWLESGFEGGRSSINQDNRSHVFRTRVHQQALVQKATTLLPMELHVPVYVGPLTVESGNVFVGTQHAPANLLVEGQVDIGTDTSTGKLRIKDNTKNALVIQTPDNEASNGIAFQNAGGHYTWNIFREDAENNTADLVIAGGENKEAIGDLTEQVRINKDGNVGIGTPSPDAPLVIQTVSSEGVSNTYKFGGGNLCIEGGNTQGSMHFESDGTMYLNYYSNNRVMIGGNVEIGTDSLLATLDVLSTASSGYDVPHTALNIRAQAENKSSVQHGFGVSLAFSADRGIELDDRPGGYLDLFLDSGENTDAETWGFKFRLRNNDDWNEVMTLKSNGNIDLLGLIKGPSTRPLMQQMVRNKVIFGIAGDSPVEFDESETEITSTFQPFSDRIPSKQDGVIVRKYRVYAVYCDDLPRSAFNRVFLRDNDNSSNHLEFRLPGSNFNTTTDNDRKDAHSDFIEETDDFNDSSTHGIGVSIQTDRDGRGKLFYLALEIWDFFE